MFSPALGMAHLEILRRGGTYIYNMRIVSVSVGAISDQFPSWNRSKFFIFFVF